MVKMPQFQDLISDQVCMLINDRLCSGWAAWGANWLHKGLEK